MTNEQRDMHDEFQGIVAQLVFKWTRYRFLSEKDRKRLLLLLGQMRMVCDSSYILDQKSRYDTKVEETLNILKNVFENGDEKVVIFSQWERMTRLIAEELDKLGVRYEYLHGGVPSEARKNLVDNFTELPESRVFLSTDAGSTGLNLQVASILINLDLPWNPAVLEQRIARIYRIGQKRNIQVINLVASNTIEERMLSTLNFKTSLFEGILDNGEDTIFLGDSKFDKIMDTIKVVADSIEVTDESHTDGSKIDLKDKEEKVDEATDKKGITELPEVQEEEPVEQEEESVEQREETVEQKEEAELPEEESPVQEEQKESITGSGVEEHPEQLVQQGLSFLSGLARTLSSPEATQKLVDSIVEEDKETGQTTLRIPVPDKESVAGILNLFGKLMAGGSKS